MKILLTTAALGLVVACAQVPTPICDRSAQEWSKFGTEEDKCDVPVATPQTRVIVDFWDRGPRGDTPESPSEDPTEPVSTPDDPTVPEEPTSPPVVPPTDDPIDPPVDDPVEEPEDPVVPPTDDPVDPPKKPKKPKCNSGRGNGSEVGEDGRDCDPGNSGGRNNGGD